MQAECYAAAMALVTSVDARPSHCALQYGVAAAVAYASALVYGVLRPCRAPASNVLNCASLCANGSMATVLALGAVGSFDGNAAASITAYLSLVVMVLSLLSTLETMFQLYFERSVSGVGSGAAEIVACTVSALADGYSSGFATHVGEVRRRVRGSTFSITVPHNRRAVQRALRELVSLACAVKMGEEPSREAPPQHPQGQRWTLTQ
jgi:hypothetical protein